VEKRNIVIIGASAGGFEALMSLVGGLPENFPAAVFIVMNRSQALKMHRRK
jgi:two-component system, chemotaxis family, protein-glutamate methylesterase/glutaminase